MPQSSSHPYQIPATRKDGWQTAHAESVGVDSAALAGMTQTFSAKSESGAHAILIERGGKLIYEEYFDGPDNRWGTPLGKISMTENTLHDLRSVTKSVISALVGIALDEGAIKSLDQPIIDWFPEYPELDTAERRRVTLAHVLSMTAGFEWNEDLPYSDPRNDEIRMTVDSEPLRYALSRPFVAEPGTAFKYNGGLTQIMAAVLERAAETSLQQYAQAKLFDPLGITEVEWMGNLAGMPAAASGLRLRARDLAKFGSLFLHGGKWNGKQLIPSSWVELSTRRHFDFPPTASQLPGKHGYGYFWWHSCLSTDAGFIEARMAIGNGQQRIFILPGLDMAITVFAGRYNDFSAQALIGRKILLDHVLPAVKTEIRPGCSGA